MCESMSEGARSAQTTQQQENEGKKENLHAIKYPGKQQKDTLHATNTHNYTNATHCPTHSQVIVIEN